MKALCYLPYSYDETLRSGGVRWVECEVINGIAYFNDEEHGFYCKSVGEIVDGLEIHPHYEYIRKELERRKQ